MQTVKLIHNPTAGEENHNKENLLEQIKNAGFECRYTSTKEEGWKVNGDSVDLIAVAGGDGTVRKVLKQLVKKEEIKNDVPLSVLPLGTANNIAKTLYPNKDPNEIIDSWKNAKAKKIDLGIVDNVPDVSFFLEGFGFGLFPYLMKEMKKREETYDSPEDELKGAIKILHRILLSYEPRKCELEIDGTDHSGKFYMVEVMNIRSIGPNMVLAPLADPGDGEFDVVLVPEAHKEKFSEYLINKMQGGKDAYHFHTLKGKKISIRWDGTRLHADDKMLKLEKEKKISIELKKGVLQFLVPANEPTNR